MKSMKAVTQNEYGGPEVLEVKDVQKPTPKSSELLVRVFSAPVTAAGTFMREGTPYLGRLATGLFKPKKNIPGFGFSGEVEMVGEDVELFKVGDLVFGETLFKQGTHAQYICVSEDDFITHKPENITHAEAAPLCDGHLTSMNFLTQVTTLEAGQRILVIGASGALGSAAVQIANEIGAHVTGVCGTSNVELVRSLGAHEVIDYKKKDFSLAGQQYDVIYDSVGKSNFKKCKPVLTDQGVYMSPVLDFKLLLYALWTSKFSRKKAKFSATGVLPKLKLQTLLSRVKTLVEEGKLVTLIDRKYTLDQISEANTYVDTGRKKGNVVLTIAQ